MYKKEKEIYIFKDVECWCWGCSQLEECWSSIHEGLGLHPQQPINQLWRCMLEIPGR